MSETAKNRIAAQILKAEMLGDSRKVDQLKRELNTLAEPKPDHRQGPSARRSPELSGYHPEPNNSIWDKINDSGPSRAANKLTNYKHNYKVRKLLASTGSLSQMFAPEKRVTTSDEVKMYLKTASKFTHDDMETRHFSQEIDDSQVTLSKGRKRKHDEKCNEIHFGHNDRNSLTRECHRCRSRHPRHLVIDTTRLVNLFLVDAKPFLSSMSDAVVSNIEHSCDSFISASHDVQEDVEKMIAALREMWISKGYRCIIMETHLRDHRPSRHSLVSSDGHFQVHCLPIKEQYFERSRMNFKYAIQNCEDEWSMNKKLLATDDRRIQRILPKGLSYFWVCFDELTNGFGHVIENETRFSQYFGLEVLSGLLDKDFNPMKLKQREDDRNQFDRSRDFKLLYSKFRQT